MNGKITRNDVIYQKTVNPHDLCYQCSKYGPEYLFGKLRIRDCRDKPYFSGKTKLISYQIKISTLFKNNNVGKTRK